MKLCVIAGGNGSRLKEEGLEIPKPLIRVNGIMLIENMLSVYKKYNFESLNIIINKNFESEIRKSGLLDSHEQDRINVLFKFTPGSLFSLNVLSEFILDSPFILMTIDSIYDESEFSSFLEYSSNAKEYDGVIAVTDYVDDEKPLWVKLNSDGCIEKFSDTSGGTKLITGGIYFFNKGIIELSDNSISIGQVRLREFLNYIIKSGKKILPYRFSKIIDIDHIWDIETAEEYIKSLKK